jgi:endoglucanase
MTMKKVNFKSYLWILFMGFIPSLYGTNLSDEILINHVGYPLKAAKVCIIEGEKSLPFKVINTQNGKVAYKGIMLPEKGNFGSYLIGIFSELQTEGTYMIEVEKKKSAAFRISQNIYEDAIKKSMNYFSIQRCGPSTTGYAAPCHVDDGRRLDTGPGWPMKPHRDVSGGWHDACDYRKWVGSTLYGMIGLCKVAEIMGPEWNNKQILDELRWGNRYFLNMQNEGGYVMNYCGGDDGMYLTDNITGTADDRPIHTEPASFTHDETDRTTQFNFILAESLTAQIFRSSDPEYSKKCLQAGIRCFEWCEKNFYANQTPELGSALMSYMELYKASDDHQFLEKSIELAGRLLELQVQQPIDNTYHIRGFFRTSSRDAAPSQQTWQGPQHIIGLCELCETVPDHIDTPKWKEAIRMYCDDYLAKLIEINNFELVPIGLYKSENPGGNQKIGDYWLRYLTVTENDAFAGGINANIASTGIGLVFASKILHDEKLISLAQRQIDWIIGLNPLNASTIEEVGHNQPIRFINTTLNIPPLIAGAVMNGIGGTMDDKPHLNAGSWQNCEYWTPQVAHVMWLMAALQTSLR